MILILLFLFVCGHALSDFALQSEYMALGKNKWQSIPFTPWYWPMSYHCLIHGLFVFIAIFTSFVIFGYPLIISSFIATSFGLIEFVLHFVIDCIKCKKLINYDIDQFLHLACKLFYVIIILILI